MDEHKEARTLLGDYNRWRLHTASVEKIRQQGGWVRTFKENPERLAMFAQMASWCRERSFDPRLWIYILFRSRAWMFAPQLSPSHLMSEKMAQRYDKLTERSLDGYRGQILSEGKQKKTLDPNVDLIPSAEKTKQRYAEYGQPDLCMRDTLSFTLGFHPKSEICQQCSLQAACKKQLGQLVPEFDLIALREGKITVEQAKAAVVNG